MKTYDSLIPYILMTMHPLLHASLFITGMILLGTNRENFYSVVGTCPEKSEAHEFMTSGKYYLMNLAMVSHAVSIICHYIFQVLNHYDLKVLANLFLMLKMMVFFFATLKIQSTIDFTECSSVTDRSMVMAWLTYEVLAYYLNIISLSVFIFIQNIKPFRSIRDRLDLAGNARKKMDFLVYSKDDVYWWSAWFTQLMLCVLSLAFRTPLNIDIKWSVIEVFAKHLLGAFLLRQLYFNSKFQFKLNTKFALILASIINVMLIFRYIKLRHESSIWWAPIVLNDIVLYSIIFAQMLIEFLSWNQKLYKWRQDLMFDQLYRKNTDQSERQVRGTIEGIVEQVAIEGLDPDNTIDMEKI
mmetsp:Transcript_11711/g.19768  ORF Transcript_11711/g.19768 Transcript_11711/m.19768 type:complete len:355 (-) Transcript_11711:871-1935(-)